MRTIGSKYSKWIISKTVTLQIQVIFFLIYKHDALYISVNMTVIKIFTKNHFLRSLTPRKILCYIQIDMNFWNFVKSYNIKLYAEIQDFIDLMWSAMFYFLDYEVIGDDVKLWCFASFSKIFVNFITIKIWTKFFEKYKKRDL